MLREALPYLQHFSGKTFLVKTGGKVVADMDFPQLVRDLVTLHLLGIKVVLVIGSGPQFDAELIRRGIVSEKRGGRRVTTAAMIAVLREIIAEQSPSIITRFAAEGIEAVDISGLLRAERFADTDFPPDHFVGRVSGLNHDAINACLEAGQLPLCFALVDGFNCNADDVALALGRGLDVEKALFLTGSKGLFLEDNAKGVSQVLTSATPDEIEAHIAAGLISGGMIPKAMAAADIVRAGIPKAHIISGLLDGSILLEIFTPRGTGTMIAAHISPDER